MDEINFSQDFTSSKNLINKYFSFSDFSFLDFNFSIFKWIYIFLNCSYRKFRDRLFHEYFIFQIKKGLEIDIKSFSLQLL